MSVVRTSLERYHWVDWVLKNRSLCPGAKVTAVRLAHHFNVETGQLNPSVEFLANKTGQKVRSITDHLRALRLAGVIDWQAGHTGRSNSYRLLVREERQDAGSGLPAVGCLQATERQDAGSGMPAVGCLQATERQDAGSGMPPNRKNRDSVSISLEIETESGTTEKEKVARSATAQFQSARNPIAAWAQYPHVAETLRQRLSGNIFPEFIATCSPYVVDGALHLIASSVLKRDLIRKHHRAAVERAVGMPVVVSEWATPAVTEVHGHERDALLATVTA